MRHALTALSAILLGSTAPLVSEASGQCAGLGLREFAVAKPPSAFLASPVGGSDISGPEWLASPLSLCAGPVDGQGQYPLALSQHTVLDHRQK